MNIENKSREYLEFYKTNYDSFRVAYETYGGQFWKYFIYPSDEYDEWCGKQDKDYEAEHREIFSDEIIIETDLNSKRQNSIFARRFTKRLRINGFSYTKWDSGNKSKHIQLFFPQLRRIYSDDKRKKLKELFIRWLSGCKRNYPSCSYCDGSRRGDKIIDCPVVINNIDMQLCGKHMIRMEYAVHPKTRKRKVLEESLSLDTPNLFPNKVVRQYNKYTPRVSTGVRNVKHSSDMMCLHYFLNKPVDDCRDRICFSLTSNLVRTKGAQEARDILYKWNKDILGGYLRLSQIEAKIKAVIKNKRTTGCTYNMQLLRELNLTTVCDYCQFKKSESV